MRLLIARLLSPLERFLRIDLRYTLSGGFFLSLTQATSAVAALALTIAFANLLPVETYGTYRYVLSVYSLLAILALPGVESAVLQSITKGYDSAFARGVAVKLRWGLLGSLASSAYAGYLYIQGSVIMGHIFLLVAIALPLMESFALYSSVLNAKKLFRTWTFIEVATQISSISSLVIVMMATKHIIILMMAYFVPYIVCRAVAAWYVNHRYLSKSEEDPGFLSYGRSMTVFQILSRAMASVDQIVLYHFLGPAQVAIFALATAIPNRIQSVFRITGTLSFPIFANRTGREIARSLPRKMVLFAFGIFIVCGAYVLIAPYLFTYIFPKYMPSLLFSQVAVFYTLSAITYPFGSYLLVQKHIRENYQIAIIGFVVKIACLALFVPWFGIWGAIIGILATSTATIVMVLWLIARERRINSDIVSIDQP